jgi:hypothetical protein
MNSRKKMMNTYLKYHALHKFLDQNVNFLKMGSVGVRVNQFPIARVVQMAVPREFMES